MLISDLLSNSSITRISKLKSKAIRLKTYNIFPFNLIAVLLTGNYEISTYVEEFNNFSGKE